MEVDDETLPYDEEDWDCPEQTEVDNGVEPDFPLTMETRHGMREGIKRNTTRMVKILSKTGLF